MFIFYKNCLSLKTSLILMVKVKVTSYRTPLRPVDDQSEVQFGAELQNNSFTMNNTNTIVTNLTLKFKAKVTSVKLIRNF